jgi:hypothetical protein
MDERAEERESEPIVPGWMLAVAGAMLCWTILAAHMPEPGASELAARIPTGFSAPNGPIDLNRSSPRELRRLPSIGPTRAIAIVRSRWGDGPFAAPAELDRIPGIGPETTKRVSEYFARERARAEQQGRLAPLP